MSFAGTSIDGIVPYPPSPTRPGVFTLSCDMPWGCVASSMIPSIQQSLMVGNGRRGLGGYLTTYGILLLGTCSTSKRTTLFIGFHLVGSFLCADQRDKKKAVVASAASVRFTALPVAHSHCKRLVWTVDYRSSSNYFEEGSWAPSDFAIPKRFQARGS